MKIGFIQTNPKFASPKENTEEVIAKLSQIDSSEIDLMVLPEMFNTGYNFDSKEELLKVAEYIDGDTVKGLQQIAKEKDMCIIAGIVEKDRSSGKDELYNSAFMITPDQVNVYRKTHLFKNEKNLFNPGDTGFNVFEFKGAKIGMMVCFDWIYPESARTLSLKGAEIIAHPANLVLLYCPEAMKTRSIENHVFTITADRIGEEDGLKFIGQSQITNPKGEILYRASSDKEEVKIIEINIEEARNKKITENNDLLEDRRGEMYKLS
ncbi:nitrilase-related carbon-nitrogen hydrolase [Nanoarchaeota archaeon]